MPLKLNSPDSVEPGGRKWPTTGRVHAPRGARSRPCYPRGLFNRRCLLSPPHSSLLLARLPRPLSFSSSSPCNSCSTVPLWAHRSSASPPMPCNLLLHPTDLEAHRTKLRWGQIGRRCRRRVSAHREWHHFSHLPPFSLLFRCYEALYLLWVGRLEAGRPWFAGTPARRRRVHGHAAMHAIGALRRGTTP